jgi:hypothetical protein
MPLLKIKIVKKALTNKAPRACDPIGHPPGALRKLILVSLEENRYIFNASEPFPAIFDPRQAPT